MFALRSALPSFSTLPDDRPLRFTDSPQHGLTSTTTSGLGSNYTNTSGITLPPTPSPRRKLSMSSFNEMAEMEAHPENRSPYFYPGRQFNYREPFQSDFRPRNYIHDDYAPTNRDAGYFGKWNIIDFDSKHIMSDDEFQCEHSSHEQYG